MALTIDQIMAKNFKEFYRQLLPYLNQPVAEKGFTPIGTVLTVVGITAPANYLICDGTIYQISSFSELAAYFERQFGSKNYFGGNGTTTFAVPDLTVNNLVDAKFCIATKNLYMNPILDYTAEEQVVGSWIDGKPLYQRVITNISVLQGVNVWLKCYSLGSTCTIVNGTAYIGKDGYFTTNDAIAWSYNINVNTKSLGDVSYVTTWPNYYSDSYKITLILQYTKTTD